MSLEGARAALVHWDIGPVGSLEVVPEGSVNRVYRVWSGHGTFYLRQYRVTDPAVLEREAVVMRAARVGGLPVPEAVPTRGGADWFGLEGQPWALFTSMPGAQVHRAMLKVGHARAAGTALARLHTVLSSLPDLGWRRYGIDYDRAEWLARLDVLEGAVLSVHEPDETDAWALKRLWAQRLWLADPDCLHTAPPTGPMGVVHGDFHDGNLFFGEGSVTGIIDWEQAAWMPRVFEAVRSAHYMFGLRPVLAATFLAAYVSALDLTSDELEAAPRSYGVQADHHVWALEEVYLHGNARAGAFILHARFRPFGSFWREVQEHLNV